MTGLFEVERERHRKATRFRRSDEFLGICAARVFESRGKRVGPFECAASEFHRSFAALERAFPNSRTISCCHNSDQCGCEMRNAKCEIRGPRQEISRPAPQG